MNLPVDFGVLHACADILELLLFCEKGIHYFWRKMYAPILDDHVFHFFMGEGSLYTLLDVSASYTSAER